MEPEENQANFPISSPHKETLYTNEKYVKVLGCLKRRRHWTKMPDRKIKTNIIDIEVPNNKISTSKYTKITFLPKNLFEQFSKLSNAYFLVIGVLQVFPDLTNTEGKPLIYLPLGVIIAISMLKDFLEDNKRWKSDKEENFKKVECLDDNHSFTSKNWMDLQIGSIVKIKQNEAMPADILILSTSEPNGICYIETKNLDGETNLKPKNANKDIGKIFQASELEPPNLWFNYERPNPYLYKFSGNILLDNGDKIPLDQQNFVLRGSSLRNTAWIIGVVAYTGHDTKIMLNSVRAKSKHSKVEKVMNLQIFLIFIIQIAFCVLCAWCYVFYYEKYKDIRTYLDYDKAYDNQSTFVIILVKIGSWILLFVNFVPISLLVTLELVKFLQAALLSADDTMKSPINDMNVTVQSSNLNEELGQIQYIFSDKTGTLTCNIMDFKNICIGGVSYGDEETLDSVLLDNKPKVTNVDFKDATFFQHLEDFSNENNKNIKDTLLLLSVCHSAVIEDHFGETFYNASSQDEIALVNFAKFAGYEYIGLQDGDKICIKTSEGVEEYTLLYTLEFNSTRKRMSTIVRTPQGQIVLYCKGADTIIFERMDKNGQFIGETWKYLDKYAAVGLRTLVLTKKVLNFEEYEQWAAKYKEACSSIQDRETKMSILQDEIEKELVLVGVTAIEDKLQQDVGNTIHILKEAGIQIWVLTGDKIETAINVGLSCNLLNDNMNKLIIDGKTDDSVLETLDKSLLAIEKSPLASHALIISGDALITIMAKDQGDLLSKLMKLAEACKAVVACRVSPKQKQEVVHMVRVSKPKAITLAIGDGANDVNMISAAHVGIGIRGLEGQQAVRASDYAIGEFRFLRKLLLSFGRESYRKNTTLICYNFYKNVLLVLPHFWFSFFNDFSGQLLYDSWLYQCFNLFYCSLPIIIYALFDEEFPMTKYIEVKNPPMSVLETDPSLYELGFKSKLFNTYELWAWIFNGTYQSAVLIFISFYGIEPFFVAYEGEPKNYSLLATGMVIFTECVVISNIKILNFSNSYHPFSLLILWGSILFYLLNLFVVSVVDFFVESVGLFPCICNVAFSYFVIIATVSSTNLLDAVFVRNSKLFKNNNHWKVLPLLEDADKKALKNEENDNDFMNSPSIIDKNSTNDNKIFFHEFVNNNSSLRQSIEINISPKASRKNLVSPPKLLDDKRTTSNFKPKN